MKIVFRTVWFHLCSILIFTVLYLWAKDHYFQKQDNNPPITLMDTFLMSTTIQSGVGMTDISPKSTFGKMLLSIQQLLMIMTNVFTIYVFSTF